jgi:hypothetical protein
MKGKEIDNMFWDWFSFISCCLGTVCSIANMSKDKDIMSKIFRMTIATGMLIMAIMYGNVILLEGIV